MTQKISFNRPKNQFKDRWEKLEEQVGTFWLSLRDESRDTHMRRSTGLIKKKMSGKFLSFHTSDVISIGICSCLCNRFSFGQYQDKTTLQYTCLQYIDNTGKECELYYVVDDDFRTELHLIGNQLNSIDLDTHLNLTENQLTILRSQIKESYDFHVYAYDKVRAIVAPVREGGGSILIESDERPDKTQDVLFTLLSNI